MEWARILEWGLTLGTLTGLEIVLGIDNIVVISILVGKLPPELRSAGRRWGLFFALFTRVAFLTCITWLTRLTDPLFFILEHPFSGRDLILFGGGWLLLIKASMEIYKHVEVIEEKASHSPIAPAATGNLISVVIQIALFDIIFSIDSVLTAVGLAQQLSIMIAAVVIAIIVMIVFADVVGEFVQNNPNIKLLALVFLIAVGILLINEGLGGHLDHAYVYVAMAFALVVELLNMRRHKKQSRGKA
jgi:predicted tellurium resistance membrane protein TerC